MAVVVAAVVCGLRQPCSRMLRLQPAVLVVLAWLLSSSSTRTMFRKFATLLTMEHSYRSTQHYILS